VFQLARESRRPAHAETTFRELSRVALTSLIFTFASLALLVCLRLAWPGPLVDPHAWATRGQSYVSNHLGPVAFTVGLEVILACLLAATAAEALSRRSPARISPFGVWYKVLRDERPDGTRPWITLHLTDGTELTGLLRHYTESEILERQEIAIGGPHMIRRSPDGTLAGIGKDFDAAVVRGDQILYMIVRYHDRNGELVRRRVKAPERTQAGRVGKGRLAMRAMVKPRSAGGGPSTGAGTAGKGTAPPPGRQPSQTT
jgi:hypothetical protein